MIGDVVGDAGIAALEAGLRPLAEEFGADFVVVNGENAAAGFGLTAETLARILAAGADVVTTGNHVWEKRDVWPTLDAEPRVLRPLNYPSGVCGHGFLSAEKAGVRWLVANAQGRERMTAIDCPFLAVERLLTSPEHAGSISLVDFHAEDTGEKEAFGLYLDGKAGAVVGTHTHVRTADERILPKGSAYMTDLGMTGVADGIIGMDAKICLERCRTQVPYRMECAKGTATISGAFISFDSQTRRAVSIRGIGRSL